MAEEEKKDGEAAEGAKTETKEEKKARKAKEKADKKAAKAAKKAGTAPADGTAGEDKKDAAAGAEGAPADGAAETPKSKKKLLIIIVLVVVLLGGAGVGLKMSGILGGGEDKKTAEQDALTKDQTLYHDMEELLVNLNNPGSQVSFLKASITLELPNQLSLNEVQEKMPRIRDMFQVYLRELRSSDLQGSAGLQRLRTELLLRINGIMEKGKVNNILFKEIIIQ